MGFRHFTVRGELLVHLAQCTDGADEVTRIKEALDRSPAVVGTGLRELRDQGLVTGGHVRRPQGSTVLAYRLTPLGETVAAELPYVRDCIYRDPFGAGSVHITQSLATLLRYAYEQHPEPITAPGLVEHTYLSQPQAWERLLRLRQVYLMENADGASRPGHPTRIQLLETGHEIAAQCSDPRVPLTVFPRR